MIHCCCHRPPLSIWTTGRMSGIKSVPMKARSLAISDFLTNMRGHARLRYAAGQDLCCLLYYAEVFVLGFVCSHFFRDTCSYAWFWRPDTSRSLNLGQWKIPVLPFPGSNTYFTFGFDWDTSCSFQFAKYVPRSRCAKSQKHKTKWNIAEQNAGWFLLPIHCLKHNGYGSLSGWKAFCMDISEEQVLCSIKRQYLCHKALMDNLNETSWMHPDCCFRYHPSSSNGLVRVPKLFPGTTLSYSYNRSKYVSFKTWSCTMASLLAWNILNMKYFGFFPGPCLACGVWREGQTYLACLN